MKKREHNIKKYIQRQGMTLTRMGKTIWCRYKNLEKENELRE